MKYDTAIIWLIIAAIAVGTFLIRFSFLGLIGGRELPKWVLRLLRFTPVAMIPGLVAPLIVTPGAPPDPALICTAVATLAAGLRTKSLLVAITAGVAVYFGASYLVSSP